MGKRKKRPRPKTGPDDRQSQIESGAESKGGGYAALPVNRDQGRRIWSKSDVAIQRFEGGGFEARLSNTPYMYSTKLVGNTLTDMSAMHFCMRQKIRASLEGRAKPRDAGGKSCKEERSGSKGGRRERPAVMKLI